VNSAMKRAILIAMTSIAALAAPPAHAEEQTYTLLITGGSEQNVLDIKLSLDGRDYIVDSLSPLEVGGAICFHPEGFENRLLCEATAIAGIEVNAGAGSDSAIISPKIHVPVTLRGGPGEDRLYGGAAADKLVAGPGEDTLIGRAGNDWLYGGPGDDRLYGGSGDDLLDGGPGEDEARGGSGHNRLIRILGLS
jgi:Ca2+-binding RTX toxin-like protein